MLISETNGVDLCTRVRQAGFGFVDHRRMRGLLLSRGDLSDWDDFVVSWNDLAPDQYLASTGRQRRRRHAVFSCAAGNIQREADQPHYQGLQYNPLQGDIQRWFEPMAAPVASGASMQAILGFCLGLFGRLAPATPAWHIEVHQFRIEPGGGRSGEPTPEGVHRDGVDYVLVLLVSRVNIVSGMTSIHAEGRQLGSFTLTHPLDAALVDDARVYHGVTSVDALTPDQPAHRDVLVVTFRARPAENIPAG